MRHREQSTDNTPAGSPRQARERSEQLSVLQLQQHAGNAAVARLLQRQPLETDPRIGATWHEIYPPGNTLSGRLITGGGAQSAFFTLDSGSELLLKRGRTIT
jgi:hypothetical protein